MAVPALRLAGLAVIQSSALSSAPAGARRPCSFILGATARVRREEDRRSREPIRCSREARTRGGTGQAAAAHERT